MLTTSRIEKREEILNNQIWKNNEEKLDTGRTVNKEKTVTR